MRLLAQPRFERGVGLLIGVAAAVALLVASRPAAELTAAPAAVRVTIPASGELETRPVAPRPALDARSIRPGGRARTGSFRVRNQTGAELALTLAARGGSTELDGLLHVRLRAGRVLADTTLQGLRKGAATPLVLPSGAERRVRVSVSIPPSISSGYEGRSAEFSLVSKTRVAAP